MTYGTGDVGAQDPAARTPLVVEDSHAQLLRLCGVVEERALKLGLTCAARLPSAHEIGDAEKLLAAARAAFLEALARAVPSEPPLDSLSASAKHRRGARGSREGKPP